MDGRKKRTAKRLCVTNVTGLLIACFVVIDINVFWSFTKRSVKRKLKFSSKIIVTLVTQGLPFSSLSRPVA